MSLKPLISGQGSAFRQIERLAAGTGRGDRLVQAQKPRLDINTSATEGMSLRWQPSRHPRLAIDAG